MSTYEITVSDKLEPVLEHLRQTDGHGALEKGPYLQQYVIRLLESHQRSMKDPLVEAVALLDDAEYAELAVKRAAKIKELEDQSKETANESERVDAPVG